METPDSKKHETTSKTINTILKKAQQEIEELALQFALGKAQASDKFEEIKKEFNTKVDEWQSKWLDLKSANGQKLKTMLDEMKLQLALGKADAKDLFEEQKKKILHILSEMETEIKNNPTYKNKLDEFKSEAEKLKLKLEILRLKFALKKFEVKDGFKNEMLKAKNEIDNAFSKVEDKMVNAKQKYSDFKKEIDTSFTHLKMAVKSLGKH